MPINLEDEAVKAIPGLVGALVALRWFTGLFAQAFASVFGGAAIAYYATPYFMDWFGSTFRDFTAFLLGLFGMALAAKVLEAIGLIDFAQILSSFFIVKKPK